VNQESEQNELIPEVRWCMSKTAVDDS